VISITLHFKSKADRDEFMGQLSDGWGEEHCVLYWRWQDGITFEDATEFDVVVLGRLDEQFDEMD